MTPTSKTVPRRLLVERLKISQLSATTGISQSTMVVQIPGSVVVSIESGTLTKTGASLSRIVTMSDSSLVLP